MFSSQNFIVSFQAGDKVLKLRNIKGQLAFIIRDATCTIQQDGTLIKIKQQSESATISLSFVSTDDCAAAHLLLREALMQLGSSNNSNILEYSFNPDTTTINVTYTKTIPISATNIYGIYVNGLLIAAQFTSVTVLISGTESLFTWNNTAEYILEPTDLITIKYN